MEIYYQLCMIDLFYYLQLTLQKYIEESIQLYQLQLH